MQAVLSNVAGESDPAVAETLLAQARLAALRYTADGAALVDALAEASLAAARAAEPGSDLQLARVRAFVAVARRPDHGQVLQALLDGTDVPTGLAVDTDLRWALVESLAALGLADDAVVEAELRRDDTAAGRLHALTARASMPDADAKERAWSTATGPAELSNHESRALAGGCWRPGQDELLRPYVDRYVADLPGAWAARTPEVAGSLATALFPSTLVSQDVLDRTAVLLEEQHPAGLRRFVAEQRDDLARALRARSA